MSQQDSSHVCLERLSSNDLMLDINAAFFFPLDHTTLTLQSATLVYVYMPCKQCTRTCHASTRTCQAHVHAMQAIMLQTTRNLQAQQTCVPTMGETSSVCKVTFSVTSPLQTQSFCSWIG